MPASRLQTVFAITHHDQSIESYGFSAIKEIEMITKLAKKELMVMRWIIWRRKKRFLRCFVSYVERADNPRHGTQELIRLSVKITCYEKARLVQYPGSSLLSGRA